MAQTKLPILSNVNGSGNPNSKQAVGYTISNYFINKSYQFIPMGNPNSNEQVAIQYQAILAYNFNSGGINKSYQFIPMLMVVAILIPNKQVAVQFQTVL